jgi:hypothetical protein
MDKNFYSFFVDKFINKNQQKMSIFIVHIICYYIIIPKNNNALYFQDDKLKNTPKSTKKSKYIFYKKT